jgi:hypothetical protein
MPLEGLEHVLSILHSDVERQLPWNHADSRDVDDIKRRPKTANDEWNAGKMRASIASYGAAIRPVSGTNAGKTVLTIA